MKKFFVLFLGVIFLASLGVATDVGDSPTPPNNAVVPEKVKTSPKNPDSPPSLSTPSSSPIKKPRSKPRTPRKPRKSAKAPCTLPCARGSCRVNSVTGQQYCKCPRTYTGPTCNIPKSKAPKAAKPSKVKPECNKDCNSSMGKCKLNRKTKAMTCKCVQGFTGEDCRTPKPARGAKKGKKQDKKSRNSDKKGSDRKKKEKGSKRRLGTFRRLL